MPRTRREQAPGAADGERAQRVSRGRKSKVMSTVQASDQDAAIWDIPFAKAEMDEPTQTESVGNLYGDDEMGMRRSAPRKKDHGA